MNVFGGSAAPKMGFSSPPTHWDSLSEAYASSSLVLEVVSSHWIPQQETTMAAWPHGSPAFGAVKGMHHLCGVTAIIVVDPRVNAEDG